MIFLTVNYYLVKKKNCNYSVKKKMEYFRFLTLPFSFIFTHAELSVLRGLIWPPNGHGHPTLFKKKNEMSLCNMGSTTLLNKVRAKCESGRGKSCDTGDKCHSMKLF